MSEEFSPLAAMVLEELKNQANPDNVAGMQRYGINPIRTLGIPIPVLRRIARRTGKDHPLALELWSSGLHEARILAGFIADPCLLDEETMEAWAADFDSWDVCDQVCSNLFDRAPLREAKAIQWSGREEEFVRRAGFVMMVAMAVHDKQMPDSQFEAFLELIELAAGDQRNFVKKAVNWALRGIGKRSSSLNRLAIQTARRISLQETPGARWIAADALRELQSEKIQQKLGLSPQ